MTRYANLNGNSNVEAYDIGSNFIAVKFYGTKKIYRYTYASAGRMNVEQAKKLAKSGRGLNSFIMNFMRYSYE